MDRSGRVGRRCGGSARALPCQNTAGLRGFTRASLFRMRQFFNTYRDDGIVAPLVRQLSWTHKLIIMAQSKRPEERHFYLVTAARERWSKRELERQMQGALFEKNYARPGESLASGATNGT